MLILIYVSICYVIFKIFKIPINQWSLATSALSVRGRVTEVPVQANTPLKEGDALFRIDPKPYARHLRTQSRNGEAIIDGGQGIWPAAIAPRTTQTLPLNTRPGTPS